MKDPKITVVIGTHNRPDMLPRAIKSVLNQTFQAFEIIVVDDGMEVRAEDVVNSFSDERIRYIQHKKNKGCSASKNTGARNARADFIAFLDDDDMWMPEKLEVQYNALRTISGKVGFSFTAVFNEHKDHTDRTVVPDGVQDYHDRALRSFNGFMAGTLMFKKQVFDEVGYFNENFPSHTDIEFIIRVTKHFKGLAINKPLLKMDFFSDHEHMGSNPLRRARGREMLLSKYREEFAQRPNALSKHLFKLAVFYRKAGEYRKARNAFKRSWKAHFSVRTFVHYLSMFFNAQPYSLLKKVKK